MTRGRVIAGLVALVAFTVSGPGQAAGRSSASGTRTLHLRFSRVMGSDVGAAVASRQYMLAVGDYGAYRIFDDANGRSWNIDTRPCGNASVPGPTPGGPGMFGAPWVMFYCSRGGFALYNITNRRWHLIGTSNTGGQAFRDAADYPFEVGARWIKLTYPGDQDCGDHIHFGCGVIYRYYNIQSRRFQSSPPMSSSSAIDLDSPSLVQPLCKPLLAPGMGLNGPAGIVDPLGKVALEFSSGDPQFLNNAALEVERGQWAVQRCGSSSTTSIDPLGPSQISGAITANQNAVVWSVIDDLSNWHGQIAGRFLPTLQPFVASVPRSLAGGKGGPMLDSTHMYVLTGRGALWRAPFPTTPAKPAR